jgi:hypothetical protein
MYWFGQNNHMRANPKPKRINIHEKIPEIFPPQSSNISITTQQNDFAIVRINTTWNRQMSITGVTIADMRSLDQ